MSAPRGWAWALRAARPWFLYDHTDRRPVMYAKGMEKLPRSWSHQMRYRAASRKLWGGPYFSPVRR